jgi:hypothetical protein
MQFPLNIEKNIVFSFFNINHAPNLGS